MTSQSDFSGDVMDVLEQLFGAAATALRDGDADTARQALTSAETVATHKLPDGPFRSELLDGCRRALTSLHEGDADAAADHAAELTRAVDARR